jgi:soluble lytic murein transglycosylase-like protein
MALQQSETRQFNCSKLGGCRRWLAIAVALACLIPTPSPAQPYGWFWTEVPARIDQGSRVGAMRVISDARARGRRLFGSEAQVRSVLRRWQREIEAAARHARLSEALITAVVMVESGGNPGAVSPAGAQGLGKLLPATARRYGVRNVSNPAQNLMGAAAYL